MPKMDLFRFRYFDPIRGRRLVTRHVLSESDAKERYGADVERIDCSKEVRRIGDAGDLTAGHVQSSPAK